ncbi:hypothetical protein ACFV4N_18770 [Actinosynnema sp. NPDC059797]
MQEPASVPSGDSPEPSDTFAYFSLDGFRFNAPGMPVDAAQEVKVFHDAVLQAARQHWLDANPGRSRVPAGFIEAFDLRLTGVRAGSARPQLLLHRPPSVDDIDWAEWERSYAAGRDVVADAFRDVARDGHPPRSASPQLLAQLRRVGATLRDDERIVLGAPEETGVRVVVDAVVRATFQTLATAPQTEYSEIALEGVIVQYDGPSRSFRLNTLNGSAVCNLDSGDADLAARARDLLALDGITAPDVVVIGETSDPSSKNPRITGLRSIEVVRTVAAKILHQQLAAVAALEPGWLGPHSAAPPADSVQRVEALIPRIATVDPPVSIVSNIDGAIVLETVRDAVELSVAIEPSGEIFLCADHVDTEQLDGQQTDYDEDRIDVFLRTGRIA